MAYYNRPDPNSAHGNPTHDPYDQQAYSNAQPGSTDHYAYPTQNHPDHYPHQQAHSTSHLRADYGEQYSTPASPSAYEPHPNHQAVYDDRYHHQTAYPDQYPPAQAQDYPPDNHHQGYPPVADPYYSSNQPKIMQYQQSSDGHYPDYDDPHGLGPHYDYDEKNPNGFYPPSSSGERVMGADLDPAYRSSTAGLAAPTRGSVAAQMAAEGAIPEKAGLRMWRSDEHSGAFTRGGKGKCCGRCCCCTMIVVGLLVVGLIAGFLLWVRPPNATFNGIGPPTAGNQVDLQPGGFFLNFDLNIGVTNPNFFGASFSKISARAFYPGHLSSPLGGGELENVEIKPHSNTTIGFPFQINYTTALDPNRVILADIANSLDALSTMLTGSGTNGTKRLAKRTIEEESSRKVKEMITQLPGSQTQAMEFTSIGFGMQNELLRIHRPDTNNQLLLSNVADRNRWSDLLERLKKLV